MKPKTTDELFQVLPIQKVKGVLEEHKKKLEDVKNQRQKLIEFFFLNSFDFFSE